MIYEQQDIIPMMENGRRREMKRSRRCGGVEVAIAKLEIVDLSGICLDTLSLSIHLSAINLATICKLDLSNNNLQNIPESLTARLLNIVSLDVRSNQLKTIPNSIGCLSKLKVLNVSGNLLHSLPTTIENCRSLEELNANFNKLTKLPDTIGFELQKLRKLSINSNKLILLPHSISHLTNLQTLDARLNCLRSLPDDLENLGNLKTLNVSQNFHYLTTLPYSIGLLMSLVELDVSYNKITKLPESMGCLKRLQKLNVVGNPLVSPPVDVIERGPQAVKEYLCGKINGTHKSSSKKDSWLGKLARCSTFNGRNIPVDDREEYMMASYGSSFDGSASPGYLTMLSPMRLFSSKSHVSR